MWNAPRETIQIEVPRRLFRAVQWRPLALLVAAFTGVSVTFCPLFLYWFGKSGVGITDWRVLTDFAVIFLVGNVYMSFGVPVLNLALRRPGDRASMQPSAKVTLLFWLLVVVFGLAIWFGSSWFIK